MAEILVDFRNLPEKIELTLGRHKEFICRSHFLSKVKYDNGKPYISFTYITKIEPTDTEKPCFECTRN